MSTAALPGFRDFYPDEFAQRSWLFERWRSVARRFGFQEYDGPPLEPLELYTRKSGDEIVGQLYNFEDKGGRAVALRPEMTPTVSRMVAARANALRKPVRWFSIPQLFRYERQQKGRLREHFQLNVDIFGEDNVAADAELLAVACEIMRACGLGPDAVQARVSDRRLLTAILEALGVPTSCLSVAFGAIDKIDRDPVDVLVQRMVSGGIPEHAAAESLRVARDSSLSDIRASLAHDARVGEALDRFDRYAALLQAHGVHEYLSFDLRIVRGLAYYTGIVFELFDTQGEFRAICGGGRYDNLLKDLGGVDLPALGFGMGDVVLGELLKARGKMPAAEAGVDVWVVPEEGVHAERVVAAAAALRRLGLSSDYVLNTEKLASQKSSKQMDAARKAGARYALLLQQGDVAPLRDLRGGGEPLATPVSAWLDATSAGAYLAHRPADALDALQEIVRLRMGAATDRP
ncbi:MAG: histidine--tRNA ligase [Gemmatimonadaceae bacterium]